MNHRPFLFVVLDGFGWRDEKEGNAVHLAEKPFLDEFRARWPLARLRAAGADVGLPEGVIGNSEVGHLNLGAGRLVSQDLVRIDRAVADGSLAENPVVREAMDAGRGDGRLHLLGLVSDGRVHSSLDHLLALIDIAADRGLRGDELILHVITDGRDTPPQSSEGFVRAVMERMENRGVGRIASVSGRFFTMDRDRRWDRVEMAWRAIVRAEGPTAAGPIEAIHEGWRRNDRGDEFIEPQVVLDAGGFLPPRIVSRDAVFTFNFRADRMRQIVRALGDPDFDDFPRPDAPRPWLGTMMSYDKAFEFPVAYGKLILEDVFAEVVSRAGLTQLHVAETEKYAHVTYFLNGGREEPFPGETRVLVPSPKVKTYDLAPEMSAAGVTQSVLDSLGKDAHDVIVVNFANTDMVGHCGRIDAAVIAVETVDACLSRIVPGVLDKGGLACVTADHGNAEQMIDPETGGPHTAHTTNPVHLTVAGRGIDGLALGEGKLGDVVPTCLELLDIEVPERMTGETLLRRK